MSDEPLVTYQGIACSEGSYTTITGVRSGRGRVIIPAAAFLGLKEVGIAPPGPLAAAVGPTEAEPSPPRKRLKAIDDSGLLIFEYRDQKIQFEHIFVGPGGVRETIISDDPSPAPALIELDLLDVRFKWQKRGIVRLDRNVKREDRSIEVPRFGKFDPKTLKNGTELFTTRDLIEEAINALPAPTDSPLGFLINFTDTESEFTFPLNVMWGSGIKAVDALEDLLNRFALVLALSPDQLAIRIHRFNRAFGRQPNFVDKKFLNQELKLERRNYAPRAAEVISTKRTIEERIAVSWEPVIPWDGSTDEFEEGEPVPLRIVVARWGYTIDRVRQQIVKAQSRAKSAEFNDLPSVPDEDTKKKRQGLLKRAAFKWFKMVGPEREFLPATKKRPTFSKSDASKIEFQEVRVFTNRFFPLVNRAPGKGGVRGGEGLWRNAFLIDSEDILDEWDNENGILKFTEHLGTLVIPVRDLKKLGSGNIQKSWKATIKEFDAFLRINGTSLQKPQEDFILRSGIDRKKTPDEWQKLLDRTRRFAKIFFKDTRLKAKLLPITHGELNHIEEATIIDPNIVLIYGWERQTNSIDDYFRHREELLKDAPAFLIESDLQKFVKIDGTSNEKELIDRAKEIIRDADLNERREVGTTWIFGGAHEIDLSGTVSQINYNSDGDTMTTTAKEADHFTGIRGQNAPIHFRKVLKEVYSQ